MWELRDADQRRFNRWARVLSWALAQIPALVYAGTSTAIARRLLGASEELPEIEWLERMSNVPGYDASLEPAPRANRR
jgi:hypothetical protein